MPYRPRPIDTSEVSLSEDLLKLREKLAENVHDLWAEHRLDQGWTHGSQRDDNAGTHPNLVPYRDLPEQDKEYDRITAMETLRAVIALGYRIERTDGTTSRP